MSSFLFLFFVYISTKSILNKLIQQGDLQPEDYPTPKGAVQFFSREEIRNLKRKKNARTLLKQTLLKSPKKSLKYINNSVKSSFSNLGKSIKRNIEKLDGSEDDDVNPRIR